jgi:hypothetical protein
MRFSGGEQPEPLLGSLRTMKGKAMRQRRGEMFPKSLPLPPFGTRMLQSTDLAGDVSQRAIAYRSSAYLRQA